MTASSCRAFAIHWSQGSSHPARQVIHVATLRPNIHQLFPSPFQKGVNNHWICSHYRKASGYFRSSLSRDTLWHWSLSFTDPSGGAWRLSIRFSPTPGFIYFLSPSIKQKSLHYSSCYQFLRPGAAG